MKLVQTLRREIHSLLLLLLLIFSQNGGEFPALAPPTGPDNTRRVFGGNVRIEIKSKDNVNLFFSLSMDESEARSKDR